MKIKIHSNNARFSGLKVYWFTIVARNGQIVATSETYTRRSGAIRTASRIGLPIDPFLYVA